jgi:hypothetical protein
MDKEQLETNIAALELLVNETADKSIDFRAQLEQAKKQLEDINKPELTPMQFDNIQEVIENAVNDFDFEDTDNYNIEYELDYDGRVNASSLEFQSSYELVEKIVDKVHALFVEAKCPEELDTTEDDNHPVEKLQN